MVALLGRELKMEVFKEPRGFLRILLLGFTMLAFSFCAGFSSYLEFNIVCKSSQNSTTTTTVPVKQEYSYPFSLDHYGGQTVTGCDIPDKKDQVINFPGDYSSDAKFFVFTGVIAWLFCIFTVIVYAFMNDVYIDQKNYPLYDMIASLILSFFFLAASSAWGHALSGLKSSGDPDTWIFMAGHNALAPICSKTDEGGYVNTAVTECKTVFAGGFGGANISVILGFLICFLFGANVYYLYKETRFANPNQGNLENSPSSEVGGVQ